MTALDNKIGSPIGHLTPEDIEQIGVELDAMRQSVIDTRGADDAAYIRKVISAQRKLELGAGPSCSSRSSRPPGCWAPPACPWPRSSRTWRSATTSCTASGTGCATRRSTRPRWEWDHASPSEQWKHAHDELHHTYTNVIGKDNDLGYGIMRVDEDQRWCRCTSPSRCGTSSTACIFEYGIAAYDLELGRNLKTKKRARAPSSGPAASRCWPRSASR